MMQHYYTPQTYQSIRREQYIDWGELLQDVPGFAFQAACREWIRRKEKRPTPADILKLAESLAGKDLEEYVALKDAYRHAPELGDTEPNYYTDGNRKGGGDGTPRPRDHTGDPFYEQFMNARYRKERWPEVPS